MSDESQDAQNADQNLAAIIAAALGPRRVTGDAGSVEQFSLSELIKLNQYLYSIAAGKLRRRGLRFNRLIPEGTVGRRAGELGTGDGNAGGWGITGGYPG